MVHFILAMAVVIALIGSIQRSRHIVGLAFLLLFGFAALRYLYGNDYASYYQVYLRISNGGSSPFGEEYLFTLLNAVSPTFQFLIVVTSAVFVFSTLHFLNKNVTIEYAWLGVLIFVINPYIFLMNLSALRQCMAMICLIAAVGEARKRHLLRYLLLIAVGAMFHKSTWILIPLYVIINDKPVKARTCWIILVSVLVVLLAVDLSELAVWVAEMFDDPNYLAHVQTDVHNSLRATLLTGIFFLYVLYNLPRLHGKAAAYGKLYLIATMLGILAYQLSFFTRIQMYFDIFSIAALPLIFQEVQAGGEIAIRPDRPLVTMWDCVNKYAMPMLIIVVYCLRYYSFFTNPMWRSFFEYQTIFAGI